MGMGTLGELQWARIVPRLLLSLSSEKSDAQVSCPTMQDIMNPDIPGQENLGGFKDLSWNDSPSFNALVSCGGGWHYLSVSYHCLPPWQTEIDLHASMWKASWNKNRLSIDSHLWTQDSPSRKQDKESTRKTQQHWPFSEWQGLNVNTNKIAFGSELILFLHKNI